MSIINYIFPLLCFCCCPCQALTRTHNFPKRLRVNAEKNLSCFIILSFIEFELIEGKIDPIFPIFNFIKYLITEFVGNHTSHLILEKSSLLDYVRPRMVDLHYLSQ